MSIGSTPAVGSELGAYRIEAVLGRGGMGVVYRALDVRLGRKVALKLLPPELAADPRFRGRFLRESHLAASIDHPGIVPIYEAGEIDGLLFLAMRYVEGEDLSSLLRRERTLDADRTAAIGRQLADALDAAHGRGLVHRDVKPSNVLVARESGDEHVYLADFGITKSITTEATATNSDQVVGTVAYAAPEVIRGETVDARADVYSLGCVLFQCLTGQMPFPRDSDVATIYAHLEESPPDVTQGRPDLPPAVDAVVAKSLAKKPADRWQSAGALAAGMTEALGGNGGVRGRARRWRVIATAAAVAAIVAAAAIVLLIYGDDGTLSPASIDANSVAVIDPDDVALTAEVGVGTAPSHVAAGAGAVWVANADDQSVSRIDPVTHTVNQTIPVEGGVGEIAVGEDAVWVVNGDAGKVSRISPVTNQVVQTTSVGNGPSGICADHGAVWVAAADDRVISRIDPSSGRVTRRLRIDSRPSGLACAGGSIWATSQTPGTLSQINPSTGDVVHHIAVGGGASGLAVAGNDVWVANTLDGTVSRVDRRRGAVAATIRIGPGDGPSAIAIGAGGVWVGNEYGGTVVRIDPGSNAAAKRLRIGNRPQGLAVVDGALWVGVRDSGARHRGGTLRVASGFPYGDAPFDPAVRYAVFTTMVLSTVYDGLTAFRRTGGAEGRTLVPDLALSLPEATDRGRTYVFQLRDGVRYSTGAPLRASDFRRGLERAMRAEGSPATQLFDRVVGAERCAREPSACDLSRGVVTDDATGTVVIHLTARDGDLLHKLALHFAAPMPPGTDPPLPGLFPPATGPYMIAGASGETVLRLLRNPHFRSWSQAARPEGYPDEITVTFDMTPRSQLDAVAHGDADFTSAPPGEARPEALRASYAGQIYSSIGAVTEYLFLNTRRPPFDDVNVRRALNYAIDRRAVVAVEGGPELAQPTCQMLPPSFPGYRPYCPYTANPGRGRAWSAPDFAKARRLVARSRTRGMHVTIWMAAEQFVPAGRVLARTLRDLGYRTSLIADGKAFFKATQARNSRAQIGFNKWGADYPAASTFLQTLFGCRAPQDPSVNYKWSRYCDLRTEQLMRRGAQLQGSDDIAADTWWARADRRVVDQAAAVPLLNTKEVEFVSRRVGNHQYHPQWGTLLDQLWVR